MNKEKINGVKQIIENEKVENVLVLIRFLDPTVREKLDDIKYYTNNYYFGSIPISETLISYCKEKYLKQQYDGGFWNNEGDLWMEFNKDEGLIKKIDDFFVYIREIYFNHIPHRCYQDCLGDDGDSFDITNTYLDYAKKYFIC